ncbi:MAG: hypothetical protein AAF533_06415 [Acidobacteriota bacterium]
MATTYQIQAKIGTSGQVSNAALTTLEDDGTVSVSSLSSSQLDADRNSEGKYEVDWNDIATFDDKPAVSLTLYQTSDNGGKQSTVTIDDLSTTELSYTTVKSNGNKVDRAVSLFISGFKS